MAVFRLDIEVADNMADKQNLSIQEILDSCRKSDGDGSGDSGPERDTSEAAEPAAAESSAAPAKKASASRCRTRAS